MCSIIGVSGKWDEGILLNILKWSRVRGLHCFGYSYINKNKIITNKFFSFDEFTKSIIDTHPKKFIAHFRYSTSGDWIELKNNQPIQLNNNTLVFNGVIDMSEKSEMEKKWNCKLNSDNDGELALIEFEKNNIVNFIKNKNISFAGLFLNIKNEIIAIRNERRPMSIGEKNECIYICSTSDILTRSGVDSIKQIKSYEQFTY